MAIWGKPTDSKIAAITYNWTQMRNDFTDISSFGAQSVAHLMYELGWHTSSRYTQRVGLIGASTHTSYSHLIAGLRKMGYKTPDSFSSYNFSTVKSSIMVGWPVIAAAYSDNPTFLGIPVEGEHGHYWLIDGVRKMTYIEILADGTGWLWDNRDFVCCNVGWGTNYNAWYESGLFDFRLQSHVSRSSDRDYYYQYRQKILPYVYY